MDCVNSGCVREIWTGCHGDASDCTTVVCHDLNGILIANEYENEKENGYRSDGDRVRENVNVGVWGCDFGFCTVEEIDYEIHFATCFGKRSVSS